MTSFDWDRMIFKWISSYVILDMYAKFQLSSMIRREARTPSLGCPILRMLKVPDWGWGLGNSWHHGSLLYVILYLCDKFQLSSMIRCVSGTPRPWSHIWRILKVPDWSLGWWGHHWYHGSSLYVIIYLCAKFQLSSMVRSVSRTHCPRSHTWRTLKVPDWSLEVWGHTSHHGQ